MNASLFTKEEWVAACQFQFPEVLSRSGCSCLDPTVWFIEEYTSSPVTVKAMQIRCGFAALVGNVASWGIRISSTTAWTLGVGWNKDRLTMPAGYVRERWRFQTSVATGIRVLWRQEQGE